MGYVGFALFGLLVYTYVGYPALALLLARLAPRPLAPRGGYEPTVSVCIAVHDGAQYLKEKLQSLQSLDYPPEKLEFLVYSDGSRDGTEELARKLAQDEPRLKVFASEQRLGKPTGLNRLVAAARGEVLLMTDVRQPIASVALKALLVALSDPEIGCVSGSLVLHGTSGAGAYWRYEKLIRNCEALRGKLVGVSGSLYAMRRADFVELPADVLLDDMFVPLSLVSRNKRVALSAAAEAYDQACSDDREFGRKVRTLAGNYQLLAKLPWLLVPLKNPLWFELVSHKLLRLVAPFGLLGLLWVSAVLSWASPPGTAAARLWQAALTAQVVGYGLAWAGPRAGRLGSLARTFVVLNLAALVGLWRFVRGEQRVTW
jgi:poly-beta-1,6-N-acetyl-D-glucosamine synthase